MHDESKLNSLSHQTIYKINKKPFSLRNTFIQSYTDILRGQRNLESTKAHNVLKSALFAFSVFRWINSAITDGIFSCTLGCNCHFTSITFCAIVGPNHCKKFHGIISNKLKQIFFLICKVNLSIFSLHGVIQIHLLAYLLTRVARNV